MVIVGLFGTDGIRGQANSKLSPELALGIGRAAAACLGKGVDRILIGRDPRLSGLMLESALASGFASAGVNVCLVGVIPTPGLAWLANNLNVPAAMISASHNPMADNGLKFFSRQGLKLEDRQEQAIEALYHRGLETLPRPTGEAVGGIYRDESLKKHYLEYLLGTLTTPLATGLKIVVDCANGSASGLAGQLYKAAGVEVEEIHAAPDGANINQDCGSTHPASLIEAVKAKGADLGLALDGDADRLIAVDAYGKIVDGDKIMLICAHDYKERGLLDQDTLVITVMSNLGLVLAARDLGIKTIAAQVGDRYVLEEMQKGGYNLGGEQSGHIIFRRYATTGDGLLSGLCLMEIMTRRGRTLAELAEIMDYLPQVLINVSVGSKEGWQDNRLIAEKIARAEAALEGRGRVLVRPSGTENLIRVMLEGPQEDQLRELGMEIAAAIKSALS